MNVDPQTLGLLLIIAAVVAVVIRLAARGRPRWRLVGNVAVVVVLVILACLVGLVLSSVLRVD